jgi:hypothetical protein
LNQTPPIAAGDPEIVIAGLKKFHGIDASVT